MSISNSDHTERGYNIGFNDAKNGNKRQNSKQALFNIDGVNYIIDFNDAFDTFVIGYNKGFDDGLAKKNGVYQP